MAENNGSELIDTEIRRLEDHLFLELQPMLWKLWDAGFDYYNDPVVIDVKVEYDKVLNTLLPYWRAEDKEPLICV